STLINDLMDICDSRTSKIVVNSKANTTLDFIRVKLNDDLTLIDSPGFILNKAMNHDVIGKDIKAYAMQMKECETVGLLDNRYYMKFESETPFTFYTSSDAKRVVKKYFRAADGLVNKIVIEDANVDVVLIGIGFITIKKPTVITTNVDSSNIEVRPSMFGGYY
ncbi:MAG: 50S ribosome-binding GTPase, partial [Bacilli bacterium]|nr:50S ribosome-binding GTPase [Bacilli bacterium]